MTDTGGPLECPIPLSEYPNVVMAHGGGGRLMQQLIERMFLPAFATEGPSRATPHDAVVIPGAFEEIAFTTDSYVVRPLFFPGGDIGKLAVYGSANDVAMSGARPLHLSAGLILEEGLPMETLWRVVQSMQAAAREAGVSIVTGDTKVVDRGKGDGIYINTSAIGALENGLVIHPNQVRAGDAVVVSGDLGRHGIAIMAVREGLEFETTIESDCAPLWPLVRGLFQASIEVHCLRDLTRGGLTSALVEIAQGAQLGITIDSAAVPVTEGVRGACEILGLDPLYVANEGRLVAFVPEAQARAAVEMMRALPHGEGAARIGTVTEGDPGLVSLKSPYGPSRILDMLSGEQLPRIC